MVLCQSKTMKGAKNQKKKGAAVTCSCFLTLVTFIILNIVAYEEEPAWIWWILALVRFLYYKPRSPCPHSPFLHLIPSADRDFVRSYMLGMWVHGGAISPAQGGFRVGGRNYASKHGAALHIATRQQRSF